MIGNVAERANRRERADAMSLDDIERIVANVRANIEVEENFRKLYERFHGPVRHYFERQGCPKEEAEDLTQSAFVRIYRALRSYNGRIGFTAWLFNIVRHVYDRHRGQHQSRRRSSQEVTLQEKKLEEALSAAAHDQQTRDTIDRLQNGIRRLPSSMRRALILRVYHNLEYAEIAVLLTMSTEQVELLLHTARRRLRQVVRE